MINKLDSTTPPPASLVAAFCIYIVGFIAAAIGGALALVAIDGTLNIIHSEHHASLLISAEVGAMVGTFLAATGSLLLLGSKTAWSELAPQWARCIRIVGLGIIALTIITGLSAPNAHAMFLPMFGGVIVVLASAIVLDAATTFAIPRLIPGTVVE
jgi:hypothetical protein